MKFMLMMHAPWGDGSWQLLSWKKEEIDAHMDFMKSLNAELRSAGAYVGGEALAEPRQAKIVQAGKAGAPEITDGPFAESKEYLAGYWILDLATPEEAYAIAARISGAPGPGGAPVGIDVEVRQVNAPPV